MRLKAAAESAEKAKRSEPLAAPRASRAAPRKRQSLPSLMPRNRPFFSRDSTPRFVVLRSFAASVIRKTISRSSSSLSVALGAVAVLTGVVSPEAARKAIEARVPAKALELNRAAFERGLKEGDALKR